MGDTTEFITRLAESIYEHQAINNQFYDLWMHQSWEFKQVEIFARNYYGRTIHTSTMVALSFLSAPDLDAKVEIVTNLFSEFGFGNREKAHIVLLEKFFNGLLTRIKGSPYCLPELSECNLLPTTKRFSEGQRNLYTHSIPQVVSRALLGQEWLAYSMLTRLYEGSRQYIDVFETLDEFHEYCEYFYVHIGEAEKDHKMQAIKAAAQLCKSDEDLELLVQGFNGFLNLTADYWQGIY